MHPQRPAERCRAVDAQGCARSGARSVSRAVELLRHDPARPWTVGTLASAVSTSVRSLQEAFRRELDTTPTAYLRRLRLERAREDLITARSDSVTVSEVAARWGFLHVSRFASAYVERFGELPSATMRRTRRPQGHLDQTQEPAG
ncbi:helix-turn-helix domain-containing protein [Curtobacterium flaccumfaciens]|uniref:helix-turn-helix domain-containing protein n=1 Tax=Curtobacterium flaccumfaciens TaxID=2035 RepID=UPI00265A06EF|nr:AraC family transcriptional regulator [Curtobacterium flaccumfaciens]MCS5505065.1 AraC family transcriptional regulator [Curtobacterium flaccumfaciens pv. flaccumfaciens]